MADLLDAFRSVPTRRFAAGEIIIEDGSTHDHLLALETGVLRIEKNGSTISRISRPGSVIGEVGILLERPATATVVAETDVVMRFVEDGVTLLATNPQVTYAVAQTLAERLDLVTTFLADLRRQYGGTTGSLAVVDEVLSSLMQRSGPPAQPGSLRDPDPID